MTVVDTTPPVGSIANPSYQLERFGTYTEYSVENLDTGTYLANTDTSNVNNLHPHGTTFDVIYDIGDDVSNTYLIRTVTVVDTVSPQLVSLVGYDPYYTPICNDYDDGGIILDRGSTYSYSSPITTTSGSKTVTYTATDTNPANSNTFTRSVQVEPDTYTTPITSPTQKSGIVGCAVDSGLNRVVVLTKQLSTITQTFYMFDVVTSTWSESTSITTQPHNWIQGAVGSFTRDGSIFFPSNYDKTLGLQPLSFNGTSWVAANSGTGGSFIPTWDSEPSVYGFGMSVDVTLNTIPGTNKVMVIAGERGYNDGRIHLFQYELSTNTFDSTYVSIPRPSSHSGIHFGRWVKLSNDGSRFFTASSSYVYVYSNNGVGIGTSSSNWTLEATINTGFANPILSGVSGDGLTFITRPATGNAKVYKYTNGTWSSYKTFTPSSLSISMSEDASYIMLGTSVYKDYNSTYRLVGSIGTINDGLQMMSSNGEGFIWFTTADDNIWYNYNTITTSYFDTYTKRQYIQPITITGNLITNISKNSVYTDAGATTNSAYSIQSTISTVDNTQCGFYTVTYTANENSNIATAIRQVNVNPGVQFNNLNYFIERYDSYVEQGITISDGDGYELTIDTSNASEYKINNMYQIDIVYNLNNDNTGHSASYVREIMVYDNVSPTGELNNPSLTTVERFGTYSDPTPGVINLDPGSYIAATDLSNVDTTLTHNSTFDVIYDLGDGVNNTYLIRTVTVVDTTPPSGSVANQSYQLERFAPYTEYGVENLDTGTYLAGTDTSNVDNTLAHSSTFDVVYDLGDDASNTYLIRTVTVVDTTPPVGEVNYSTYSLERLGVYTDQGVTNLDAGTYLANTDTSNVDNTLSRGSTFDVIYDIGDDLSNLILTRTVTILQGGLTETKIYPSNPRLYDFFGICAVSGDGTTVLVSTEEDLGTERYTGAGYVYEKVNGTWTQVAKLTRSNAVQFDRMGKCVALSDDGSIAFLCSRAKDKTYIYNRGVSGWSDMTQESTSIVGGGSVAVSGSQGTLTAFAGGSKWGQAYVHERTGTASWAQRAVLTTPYLPGQGNSVLSFSGQSASISSDGSVVVATAYSEDNYRGYVYVYVKPGSGWANTGTETAKLSGTGTVNGGTSNGTYFGIATQISGDGNTIAVATNNGGYVYIFDKPTNGWTDMTETTKLTGYNGGLHYDISMVKDGSAIFAGTSGSATYFCEKINGVWGNTSDYQTKLSGGGSLGSSVSTSADGTVSVVGDTRRADNGDRTGVATIMDYY